MNHPTCACAGLANKDTGVRSHNPLIRALSPPFGSTLLVVRAKPWSTYLLDRTHIGSGRSPPHENDNRCESLRADHDAKGD